MTTIMIGGEKIELSDEDMDFDRSTLDEAMEKVAAVMSRTGEIWAAAEEQAMNIETAYKAWRAEQGVALLDKDPKLAEWKVNQALEAKSEFSTYRDAIARAQRAARIMKTRFDAIDKKASAMQSRGAMLRAELEATGMTTKASGSVSSAKKEKAKAALSGGRR